MPPQLLKGLIGTHFQLCGTANVTVNSSVVLQRSILRVTSSGKKSLSSVQKPEEHSMSMLSFEANFTP